MTVQSTVTNCMSVGGMAGLAVTPVDLSQILLGLLASYGPALLLTRKEVEDFDLVSRVKEKRENLPQPPASMGLCFVLSCTSETACRCCSPACAAALLTYIFLLAFVLMQLG